jgi:hypothetical protein
MKITLLLNKDNQVYASANCHKRVDDITGEEYYTPSLVLDPYTDADAIADGHNIVIIDRSDIPEGVELWQCHYVNGRVEYCAERVELILLSKLRSERQSLFDKYDKYQLPYVQSTLTEEQVQEYTAWRQAWLDVTETRIKPERPEWFSN